MTPRAWAHGLRSMGLGPGEGSTPKPATRRTASPPRGSRFGGGGGTRPWYGTAAGSKGSVGLRASGFFGEERRSLPARERRSDPGRRAPSGAPRCQPLSGSPELRSGVRGAFRAFGRRPPWGLGSRGPPRPGEALQVYGARLALPPTPGAGAEGFGCRFARTRRAGTRPRKGPPILSRPVPYRQVRCRRPRSGRVLPRGFGVPSRPRLMRRRVVPRPGHGAAGILPLHPTPRSV